MDTREAARRWAETWQRGWETLDPEEIVELYADGCLFLSSPFRAHEAPGDYVRRALAEADWAKPWFGEPIVEADRAAVEWWAATSEEGREITLAGVSLLRFDRDGRCIEQRDTWALEEGRVERP